MNVQVENISSIKKKLLFEVAPETVAAEIDKAYTSIAKTAKVKGFRPGKVPRNILEKYYAPQMEQQVLSRLINDTYFKAVNEHNIPALGDPEIVESSSLAVGSPFTYEAHVEIKPEVEAKDYFGLELKKEILELDPGFVDNQLNDMRSARAELQVVDRQTAENGDFVIIDFEGFVDNVAFEGGKAEGYTLELGSNSFIPGFEDQLVGMNVEESKDIEVAFPENYGNAELAGKPATFKVKLHEIKAKVMPELDDEFAKGFQEENLEGLKARLQEHYESQERGRVDGDLRERLIEGLIERNPIEVPESMVGRQLEYMLNNIKNRLRSQGMSLEMMGMNEESFKHMYQENAVKQVQGSLLLEAIGAQEGLKVEDSEMDSRLEKIAEMSHAPLDAVRKHFSQQENKEGLIAQILEEKVIELLLEKAQLTEVTKAELAPAEEEAEQE